MGPWPLLLAACPSPLTDDAAANDEDSSGDNDDVTPLGEPATCSPCWS